MPKQKVHVVQKPKKKKKLIIPGKSKRNYLHKMVTETTKHTVTKNKKKLIPRKKKYKDKY
jgi:hypothetical protein